MKVNSSKRIIWNSGTAMRVLTLFFENPTKEFFGREVKDGTCLSAGAVHKYLKKMESEGILVSQTMGRMKFFRLSRILPLIRPLKAAYSLSLPIIGEIIEAGKIMNEETGGIGIYLYGSTARGEDTEGSDWDILVIGRIDMGDVSKAFEKARKAASPRKIRISLYTSSEWAETAKKDPAFYERVEKDKIRLI